MTTERWLIVGCGYVGSQVALLARQSGHIVYALTRSKSRFGELQSLGIEPCLGHWLEPNGLSQLPAVDRILVSVPHRADDAWAASAPRTELSTADRAATDHTTTNDASAINSATAELIPDTAERTHVAGLQNLYHSIPNGWQKLLYLSTTGVYGNSSTEWIDEDTPVSPQRIGPRIAVAAEQWLNHAHSQSNGQTQGGHCILRLAGIYGPDRIPLAERLRSGQPLAVPRQGHLNLVHVSDIAHMVCLLLTRQMQRSTYLLSDGQPVLRDTFYRYLAELCGVAQPQFVQPDAQSGKARRATDKRISPARLLAETGYRLQFPDYRSGLANALAK